MTVQVHTVDKCMANTWSSLAGRSEARYSNGPDSGCLARVDNENLVAADDGELLLLRFGNPTASLSSGGLVYRLKLGEWSWIQEEEVEAEAGGHCTFHLDALLFTSGHSYNLTSGRWSKVRTFLMISHRLFPRWFVLLQLSPLDQRVDSPCSLALLTGHRFQIFLIKCLVKLFGENGEMISGLRRRHLQGWFNPFW